MAMTTDPRRAKAPSDDVVKILSDAADAGGIPRLLLVACCCAESGLDPFARRPANAADDERYWPDLSGGVAQQTVRWDPDYSGDSTYPGEHEIERVLKLQYDVARSARIAAANLHSRYRPAEADAVFKALCRYNWPAGNGAAANASVAANYRRGISDAQALLGADPPPAVVPDVTAILNQVIALGKLETGKPYSGPIVGEPESSRWGDPGWDCLSAGTLIETRRGPIPIESILPGDQVLTRVGYRPVRGAWLVGERETWRLRVSNGAELVGTANHRIWTAVGWRELGTLTGSVTLLACDQKSLSSTESDTDGIRTRPAPLTESTSRASMIRSIERSGGPSTGLFPRVTRFTTSTTTRSTITLPISHASPSLPIVPSPLYRDQDANAFAVSAAPRSSQSLRTSGRAIGGSAPTAVTWPGVGLTGWIAVRSSAANVAHGSRPSTSVANAIAATPAPSVPVDVLSAPEPAGRALVYDLAVDGQPEFFANGILVHNCSSFVSGMYSRATNGAIKLTAFTDAAHDQCEWDATPLPGDIVFYHYADDSQPGVTFPHMGIWLSPSQVLDCRYPMGVGIHDHVTPIGPDAQGRYRVTMRPKGLASVAPAPGPTPAPVPPPVDPRDAQIAALTLRVSGLETAVAHLADVLAGDRLTAVVQEASAIRTQFLGTRPA